MLAMANKKHPTYQHDGTGCYTKRNQPRAKVTGHDITCEHRFPLHVPLGDRCTYGKVLVKHQGGKQDAHEATTRNANLSCKRV